MSLYDEESANLDTRDTKLLIDRFKFMNLYPCSRIELKSIGYKDINNNYAVNLTPSQKTGESLTGNLVSTNSTVAKSVTKEKGFSKEDVVSNRVLESCLSANPFTGSIVTRPRYPEPDVSKMYPFKQSRENITALQPVPGGGLFLFPSIFAETIKRLPPPSSFHGPYVSIDEFLAHFQALNIPSDFQTYYKNYVLNRNESKRDEDVERPTGSMDIYKQRHQKKMIK